MHFQRWDTLALLIAATALPLGQWYQRSLMRKNLIGMLQTPARVFWHMELQ
jgi:hypothetical protein